MTKLALALGVLTAVMGTELFSGEKENKLTAKSLVGTYELVAGERDGKPIPKDELNAATIRFTADTITAIDKEDKNVYVAKYRLADEQDGRITMNSIEPKEGMVAEGLVKSDGATLKIIYALPGGKTPTTFKTAEKQQLFVLRKVDKK